jgi:hypothetical protein
MLLPFLQRHVLGLPEKRRFLGHSLIFIACATLKAQT